MTSTRLELSESVGLKDGYTHYDITISNTEYANRNIYKDSSFSWNGSDKTWNRSGDIKTDIINAEFMIKTRLLNKICNPSLAEVKI